jgi:hypothetical protein
VILRPQPGRFDGSPVAVTVMVMIVVGPVAVGKFVGYGGDGIENEGPPVGKPIVVELFPVGNGGSVLGIGGGVGAVPMPVPVPPGGKLMVGNIVGAVPPTPVPPGGYGTLASVVQTGMTWTGFAVATVARHIRRGTTRESMMILGARRRDTRAEEATL